MTGYPTVSVIVPTHRRPEALARCVASLLRQAYPRERLEILVVNDGGTALPASSVAADSAVAIIDVPHGGPAAARNAGIAMARGDVLAFIDDDCEADPGWLAALVARLASNPEAAVGGRVINALPDNRYARASHLLVAHLYRYYHEERRGRLPFFTTNNLGVRSATMAQVGPFDTSFSFASEDRDWSDRCLVSGRPLVYAPEALVHHAHPLTFESFFRQHFRYGEGAPQFHRRRAGRRGIPVRLEGPSFYLGMMAAPFVAKDPEPVVLSILIMASQFSSAAGWAKSAISQEAGGRRQEAGID